MISAVHAKVWDASPDAATQVIKVWMEAISIARDGSGWYEVWQMNNFFYYPPCVFRP
jgi:hypothetical protein